MTDPEAGPRGEPPDGGRHRSRFGWTAEAALASITVVSAVGMTRLFVGTSFMRDVLAIGLASHLVAAAARRTRLPLVVAAALSAGCLAVTTTVLRYGATAWLALPTGETVQSVREHLTDGWNAAGSSSAPVEPAPGLVLTAGFALWVAAFLADTAAFRWRGYVSALAPATGLFLFTAAVGTEDGQAGHAALFCASAAAALVALRLGDRRRDAWIEARPGRGARALGRTGAVGAAAAVAAGAFVGPMLPGVGASPWLSLEGVAATGGTRVVVSPLVQVRSRLVHGADVELFTVAVAEQSRQYWRLMSLDEFDGAFWRARSQFAKAVGPLETTLDPSAAGPSLVQTVSLTGLGGEYLPAAYEPLRVLDDGGTAMQYEASSGALIKAPRASREDSGGLVYTVESVLPSIADPGVLEAARTDMVESAFLAFNTDLPDDVRDLVGAEARRVTAAADSDYRRALDLQDYFWAEGRFAYDTDIARGAGIEDLEDFLFGARAGYCEQFASAYAAMARSVGLPARVAVGFTWGEWDPDRSAYKVRGEHAHAWPEVYFAGTGWVRFEPTPGRGGPDDFAVTGRVPDQAGFDPEAASAADAADEDAAGLGSESAAERRPAPLTRAPGAGAVASASDSASDDSPGPAAAVLAGVLALAVLGVAAGLVPGLRILARRRRRGRLADDPAGLVEESWAEALSSLETIGLGPRPSETPLELVARLRSAHEATGPVDELAALATAGRYAKETRQQAAIRADVLAAKVVEACRGRAGLRRRLVTALNPATILR